MGLRGPQPLSGEQLAKRGSHRAKARIEQEQQEPLVGPNEAGLALERWEHPPDDMCADAKAFWKLHCEDLVEAGLLTYRSYAGFVMLCLAWADYQEAVGLIYEGGELVKGSRGQLKKNPAIQIREKAMELFTKLAWRFGITP